jgi:hypothetical protein
VFILKGVKVICFDTLLQVLILKEVRVGGCWRVYKQLFGRCPGAGDKAQFGFGFEVRVRVSFSVGVGFVVRGRNGEGGADDVALGVGVEGVDVFVLSDVDGLQQGLAEISQSGGGLGLDLTLGDGGKHLAESGTEVASGEIAVGEARGNIAAYLLGGEGLRFLAGMEVAEVRMSGAARNAAAAAIGKGERTQRGTILGGMSRHGNLQIRRN